MIYEDMVNFADECQALAKRHSAKYTLLISEDGAKFSSTFDIQKFSPRGEINNVPSTSKLVQARKKPGRKAKKKWPTSVTIEE